MTFAAVRYSLGCMELLVVVFIVIGIAAWFTCLVSAIAMVKHRAAGVSVGSLMLNGAAFFSGSKFTEHAAPHRKRFLIGTAVFFGSIVLLGVLTAVQTGG